MDVDPYAVLQMEPLGRYLREMADSVLANQKRVGSLAAGVDDVRSAVDRLGAQVSALEPLLQRVAGLEQDFPQLRGEVADAARRADEMGRQSGGDVGDLRGLVDALSRRCDEERRAAAASEAATAERLSGAEQQAAALARQGASLADRTADAEQAAQRAAAYAAELAARVSEAEGLAARAEAQGAETARRAADARSAADGRASELQDRVSALERCGRETQARAEAADSRCADVAERTGALERAARDTAARADAADGRLASCERAAVDQAGRAADTDRRVAEAMDKAAAADRRAEAADHRAKGAEGRCAELSDKLSAAERKVEDMDPRLRAAATQSADAVERLAAAERKAELADGKLRTLATQCTDAADRAAAVERRLGDADARHRKAERAASERADAADRKVADVARDLGHAADRLSSLEQRRADADAAVDALKLAAASLVEQMAACERNLAHVEGVAAAGVDRAALCERRMAEAVDATEAAGRVTESAVAELQDVQQQLDAQQQQLEERQQQLEDRQQQVEAAAHLAAQDAELRLRRLRRRVAASLSPSAARIALLRRYWRRMEAAARLRRAARRSRAAAAALRSTEHGLRRLYLRRCVAWVTDSRRGGRRHLRALLTSSRTGLARVYHSKCVRFVAEGGPSARRRRLAAAARAVDALARSSAHVQRRVHLRKALAWAEARRRRQRSGRAVLACTSLGLRRVYHAKCVEFGARRARRRSQAAGVRILAAKAARVHARDAFARWLRIAKRAADSADRDVLQSMLSFLRSGNLEGLSRRCDDLDGKLQALAESVGEGGARGMTDLRKALDLCSERMTDQERVLASLTAKVAGEGDASDLHAARISPIRRPAKGSAPSPPGRQTSPPRARPSDSHPPSAVERHVVEYVQFVPVSTSPPPEDRSSDAERWRLLHAERSRLDRLDDALRPGRRAASPVPRWTSPRRDLDGAPPLPPPPPPAVVRPDLPLPRSRQLLLAQEHGWRLTS